MSEFSFDIQFSTNFTLLLNRQTQFNRFYIYVREKDFFLKGYIDDCKVPFTCSYIHV